METKNQVKRDNSYNQTKEELAEQGFTVRDGHDPDKPNSYEQKSSDEISKIKKIDDDFHTDKDLEANDLDNEGNVIKKNDELDNPSDLSNEDE